MLKLVQGFDIFLVLLLATYGTTQMTYSELKDLLPEKPHNDGVLGKYLNYPSLSYEPNVPSLQGLIRANKARPSTYKVYVDHMSSVLSRYQNAEQSTYNMIYCYSSTYAKYRPHEDWGKNCRFDLSDLGSECTEYYSYGYEDGQPCIILSLERDPVSRDSIGDIEYYPKQGFPFKFYPNLGTPGWKNPLVAIRLVNPNPAIAIRVTCTAYAKNLMHYDKLNTGKVSFDVMVD